MDPEEAFSTFLSKLDTSMDQSMIYSQIEKNLPDELTMKMKKTYAQFIRKLSDIEREGFPKLETLESMVKKNLISKTKVYFKSYSEYPPKNFDLQFSNEYREKINVMCNPLFNGVKPETKDGYDIFESSSINKYVFYIEFASEDHKYRKIFKDSRYEQIIDEKITDKEIENYKYTIFMMINPNVDKIVKEDIILVTWTLYDNYMDYEFRGNFDPLDKIKRSFKGKLSVDKVFTISENWSLQINNRNGSIFVQDRLLSFIVTNYKFPYTYFIREYKKPFHEKSVSKFAYFGRASKKPTSVHWKQSGAGVELVCTDVPNLQQLKEDMDFFFRVYLTLQPLLSEEFSKYNIQLEQITKTEVANNKLSKLAELQRWGQENKMDIFNVGYATVCQGDRKPTLTNDPPDDLKIVKFDFVNKEGDPVSINLKCDNPENPYPAINKDSVPCCFKNPQSDEPKRKKIQATKASSGFLDREQRGKMQQAFDIDGLIRIGVIEDSIGNVPNNKKRIDYNPENLTLASCVRYAFGDTTPLWRVMEVMRSESQNNPVYPYVYMQELYDQSKEDIYESMISPDFILTLDYLRGLEEAFNINIFSLELVDKKVVFELPRHRNGYIKVRNDKPSILVYKNTGSNAEKLLKIFRYELLTLNDEIFFDTKHLFDLFESYVESYILSKSGVYSSYLNLINYKERFEPVGQAVDVNGKLSSILTKAGIIIDVLPSAPLNLPVFFHTDCIKITEGEIVNLFGKYNSKDSDFLYYNLDELEDALAVRYKCDTLENTNFHIFKQNKKTAEIILYLMRWCMWEDDKFLGDVPYQLISDKDMVELKINVKRKLPNIYDQANKLKYLEGCGCVVDGKFLLSEKYMIKAMKLARKYLKLVSTDIDGEDDSNVYIPHNIYYPDLNGYVFESVSEFFDNISSENIVIRENFEKNVDPYLIKVKNSMYMIQPCNGVWQGIEICKQWEMRRVNVGANAVGQITDDSFVLFKNNLDSLHPDHRVGKYKLIVLDGDDEDRYYAMLKM